MRDPVKTIGNLIDRQGVSFISSVDENGYPNTKAMLPPRRRNEFHNRQNYGSGRISM